VKLIVRQYLASLKERGELDTILPDLLSSLGLTVYSRPGRGTTQHGVDIAAVGKLDDGEEKIFLLSVKQGNLTRQDWNGPPQALRPSLDDILDVYIPNKIPKRYKHLKIAICLCFGGDMQEQVRDSVEGYIRKNTTSKVSFEVWNGDEIAGLILRGILREEILPKSHRSSFQKAVALVDEPDAAYNHFADLVRQLRSSMRPTMEARVTVARQLNICLWILFVWARDIDNVEAPYRSSELSLLAVWDLLRPLIERKGKHRKAIIAALHQLINLHLTIASEFLERKIFHHVDVRHGLSMAVASHNAVDVNLRLFDLLGRIAMTGLWLYWLISRHEKVTEQLQHGIAMWAENGFKLIDNNPSLFLPLTDDQSIDVTLFLVLAANTGPYEQRIARWLHEMVGRLNYAVRAHGRYPCVFNDYKDLINHPREKTDTYRVEATAGSTLVPLLAAWLTALGDSQALRTLVDLKKAELAHCTLQLWLPDKTSDEKLYCGEREHGISLCDLPLSESGKELLEAISEGCRMQSEFSELSASKLDYWPVVLLACRHYRFPVPPQYWIDLLSFPDEPNSSGGK
jgi:hypothetical protein